MPLSPDITFQAHQQGVRDEAAEAKQRDESYRKMLVWGVGTGKTIGALGAADALGGTTTIVAPAAVRPSFRQEADRTLPGSNVPVVSYHGAAAGKAPPADNLVIDESQRLGSSGSAQAAKITDLAQKARNVILLSGTPIRNHPHEFAPLMSILTGKNISHDEFDQRYIGTEKIRPGLLARLGGAPTVERPALKNKEELKALLAGRIDYYENETPPIGAPSSVTYEDVESEMTPEQSQLYQGFWDKLPYITKWKLKNRYDLTDAELARAQSFLVGPRQVALSTLPYRPDGDPLKAFEHSGKLRTAMDRLRSTLDANPAAKVISYSNYPVAGLKPYAAALGKLNIPHAVFHGGLSDVERKQLVNDFNANKLRVALVGPAGAEGISLKGAQRVQLLDNHWNQARMTQAQARGIRFDSHLGLPEDLRGVTVERHIAKLPLGMKDRMLQSLGFDRQSQRSAVDDYLRDLSHRKEHLNSQLLDLLKEVGTHNRTAKTAADRISVKTLLEEARAAVEPLGYEDAVKVAALQQLVPGVMDGVDPAALARVRAALAQLRTQADAAGLHYFAVAADPKSPGAGAEVSSVPRNDKQNVITRHADLHREWSTANGYQDVDWAQPKVAALQQLVPNLNTGIPPASIQEEGTAVNPINQLRQQIVIENPKGSQKEFGPDYPIPVMTYPVDYGSLPGHVGEDGDDLDFFVGGGKEHGRFRVWRPDVEGELETKYYHGLTPDERQAVLKAYAPVVRGTPETFDDEGLMTAIATHKVAGAGPNRPALLAVNYSTRVDKEPGDIDLDRIDAHVAGKNVGYLTSHPGTDGNYRWLKGMRVDPQFRGQGIAKSLLDNFLTAYPDMEIRLRAKPYEDSPLDAEGLKSVYARRGFVPLDDEDRMVRAAQPSRSAVDPRYAQAKAFSDLGTPEGYARKRELLRRLIQETPKNWVIDSHLNKDFVGLTANNGWRYHLPTTAVQDLNLSTKLTPKA